MADVPPATPDDPAPPAPRRPGEAIPAERRLARPPSDRFRRPAGPMVVDRPDLVRATLLGGAVALGTAAVLALFAAILSITAGLLAISILGGWLIGVGVRQGAWSGQAHRPSRAPLALAAILGALTWLAGLVLAWVVSMAILPGSTRTFLERLDATPFLDWIGPQLEPLDWIRLLLLVAIAWVAAHTTAQERAAAAADAARMDTNPGP